MSGDLKARTALITGAAAGIGLSVAEQLLHRGARVLLADRNPEVHETALRLGPRAAAIEVDLQSEQAVLDLAKYADNAADGCDILINNAGLHPKKDGRPFKLEELEIAHWEQVLWINLTAPFLLCRELMPAMRRRGWGRVINVASRVGRTYVPFSGLHYSASKAGLIGLTRQLGGENAAFGITVNCVVPGRIDTPRSEQFAADLAARLKESIPANRWGTPEDAAASVAYLASDSAAFITGACLDINGGAFIG
jgi:3-oxoacyl-[acyl-carrier protein] reductase